MVYSITLETHVNNFVTSEKQGFLYDRHMDSKFREYLLEKQALNGWKQDELAAALGFPKGTVSRWVRGLSQPNYENMVQVAKGLGVDFQEVKDARDGKYKPISKAEREALEIEKKFSPESISLAFQRMAEENPEILKEFARSKMHLLEQFREIEKSAKKKK